MTLTQLLMHCTLDTATMVDEGYDSWVPNDDVMIKVKSENGLWYTCTYIQLVDPNISWQEPGNRVLIVQLEGRPEDPANFNDMTDLPVQIYKELVLTSKSL